MAAKSAGVTEEKLVTEPRHGRTPKADRSEIILSNGLSARQWEWIQKEAASKTPQLDGAQYQRYIVDIHIDAVEASRAGSVATPNDDEKFEKLVDGKSSSKSKKSNKNKKG